MQSASLGISTGGNDSGQLVNAGVSLRSEAIGMIKCGVAQKDVAQRLNVGERSVRRWWRTYNVGDSLDTQVRFGRPKCLNRVAKIIINKSMGKDCNQLENEN